MKTAASFTLIELMAASTVLSIILLLMVGMQDQMSRAWSNANRRTDATREASAASRLMAEDLSCLVYRPPTFDNKKSGADCLTNQGVPFLYSSNGANPGGVASINKTNRFQSNAAYLFGIVARKPSGTMEDLAIVGYYIASASRTNVNGFSNTTYNLYRHYVPASKAASNLGVWFTNTNAATRPASVLFQPDPDTDDILARNTCNLRITAYNRADAGNRVSNGLNYQFPSGGSTTYYSGSKLQVELSVYPEDFAQKLAYTNWALFNNIQKYARSYEFRIDVPRD